MIKAIAGKTTLILKKIKKYWARINRNRWQVRWDSEILKSAEVRQLEVGGSSVNLAGYELLRLLTPTPESLRLVELELIGDGNDGSYVVPSGSFGSSTLLSPGVGPSSTFELELAKRGMRCVLVDGSVKAPADSHENFTFLRKFIGPGDDELTLDQLIETYCGSDTFCMQMDIEGAEWWALGPESINDENLEKTVWLAVEFHSIHLAALDIGTDQRLILSRLFNLFVPIHLNVNNTAPPVWINGHAIPPVVEVTFIRKRLLNRMPSPIEPKKWDMPAIKAASWRDAIEWPF